MNDSHTQRGQSTVHIRTNRAKTHANSDLDPLSSTASTLRHSQAQGQMVESDHFSSSIDREEMNCTYYRLMAQMVSEGPSPQQLKDVESKFNQRYDFLMKHHLQIYLQLLFCASHVKGIESIWTIMGRCLRDLQRIGQERLNVYQKVLIATIVCNLAKNCKTLPPPEYASLMNVTAYFFNTKFCNFTIIKLLADYYLKHQNIWVFVAQFNVKMKANDSINISETALIDTTQLINVLSCKLLGVGQEELDDHHQQLGQFLLNALLFTRRNNKFKEALGNFWSAVESQGPCQLVRDTFLHNAIGVYPECLTMISWYPIIDHLQYTYTDDVKYFQLRVQDMLRHPYLLELVLKAIMTIMDDLVQAERIHFCDFLHKTNVARGLLYLLDNADLDKQFCPMQEQLRKHLSSHEYAGVQ